MENSRFPNKLKLYRRSKGYSQKRVAKLLKYSDTATLSRWEHGIVMPNVMQLFFLAAVYGKLPHDLYDELWHYFEHEISLLALDEHAV